MTFNHKGVYECEYCAHRTDDADETACPNCPGHMISSAVKAERLAESAWEAEQAFEKFHAEPTYEIGFMRVRQGG